MTLPDFYLMLRPYCTSDDLKKKNEYIAYMIGHIIEEQWEAKCPVLDASDSFLRRILSGKETLPFESVQFINAHIDKERFSDSLEEFFNNDSIDSLINLGMKLQAEGYDNDGMTDTVVACCADLYESILLELEKTGPVQAETTIQDEATRAAIELRRICDNIKPNPVPPPPAIVPEEAKYIAQLFAAYGSAVGLNDFGEQHLQEYAYADDLADRRIDYFAAETIRRGVQELFNGRFADQFDVLKNETYSGVKNTERRQYPNGYERMLAVMEKAVQVPVEQYLLS
ncbi:MAG: hypothetical protein K6A68_14430, partial [Clostridiales bacterium]|nr:hypothetical protein [Clostridiales bacterium]